MIHSGSVFKFVQVCWKSLAQKYIQKENNCIQVILSQVYAQSFTNL